MGLINLLISDPVAFVILSGLLLYSVIFHELAHGWVAYKLGDPTAKWLGRLTLNPIKHLDLIGSAMLLVFGFGWAKPVPVNLENIAHRRGGLILVSAAGIVTNIFCAFFAFLLYRVIEPEHSGMMEHIIYIFARINIMLAAFNLIPIPPLDGSKILMGLSSEPVKKFLTQIEPFGFFIVIGLLYIGALNPLINFFQNIIMTFIKIILFI